MAPPDADPSTQFKRAVRLQADGRLREAFEAYQPLLHVDPHKADVAANLSILCLQVGDRDGAERYARSAVALDPGHANGWNHLALALKARGATSEAAAAFERTVALEPTHAPAWFNIGEARTGQSDMTGAIEAYGRAIALDPAYTAALVGLVHRKQQIADWDGLDDALIRLSRRVASGDDKVDPFALLFCCTNPAELLKAAQNNAAARRRTTALLWGEGLFPHAPRRRDRIRIGYVSANFNDHPVGVLICKCLEQHDRTRFEVHCYCHTAVKTGERRDRIKRAADRFVEIDPMNDRAAAELIHRDGIDILVDLMGYTNGQRLKIFALRPAPVQVTWLGFAGTVGGEMDYLIADKALVPDGAERFYLESVVRMPACYQPNEDGYPVSDKPMTRADFGLPETATVFCCFNQTAKITPPIVDLWGQILQAVPGSVLWLRSFYPVADGHLREAFRARGLDPGRLRFAGPLAEPEYLKRYSLCDLFLDTFPFSAHATGSHALFGGCPLLALPGQTFASRVSASMLMALGLRELIASSPQDYVAKAVRIGADAELRLSLKQRLAAAQKTSPLFDAARFARDIERAYTVMIDRFNAGEKPAPIALG
jgi:predicted O-linked N-acetylglucosamine transferase (SPINDLY family)